MKKNQSLQELLPEMAAYDVLDVSSPSFKNGEKIPVEFTCDGENVNPPLDISRLPAKTVSLALIVEDPDAPLRSWTHWLVWNIAPTRQIGQNSVPGTQGINDFTRHRYMGPCPPGSAEHRYMFKIFALDCRLDLPVSSDKRELEAAMEGRILAFGELTGMYSRKM